MTPTDEEIAAYLRLSIPIFKVKELPDKKPKNYTELFELNNLPKLDDEEPFCY